MVPSTIVMLEQLPLLPSGKVDVQALACHELSGASSVEATPRTPIERVLCTIFAEVLDVDNIGIHDDFFDLCGHSLLAVRLASRIRDELGLPMKVRDVLEVRSVEAVAALVEEWQRNVARGRGRRGSHVISLESGTGTPVVFVHALRGEITSYRDLSRARRGRPTAAIRSPLLDEPPAREATSVAELVAGYVDDVAHAFTGGVAVAGWAAGGVLAFELARQLSERGLARSIILFDSAAPRVRDRPRDGRHIAVAEARMLAGHPLDLSALEGLDEDELERLYAQALGLDDRPLVRRYLRAYEVHSRLRDLYAARPSRIPLLMLHTGDGYDRAWDSLAAVQAHRCSGDHHTLLQAPHAHELAAAIQAFLAVADGPSWSRAERSSHERA
jgi:thioesterase domain-containing protein/acyl carrier protein